MLSSCLLIIQKLTLFKFNLAFYLDLVDTSLEATTLTKYSKSTFLLNVDDYHRFTSRDNVSLPVYQAQNQYPLITGNRLQTFFAITYIYCDYKSFDTLECKL